MARYISDLAGTVYPTFTIGKGYSVPLKANSAVPLGYLGVAATLAVGTTAGTVAAGDDARFGALAATLAIANGGTGATTAEAARTNLGVSTLAAVKSNLSATSAPTVNSDASAGYAVGSTWIDITAKTTYQCVDATTAAAVWKAPVSSGGGLTGTVAIANGGTGATTAEAARTNLGLGNVDNTSDSSKPLSTAATDALASKEPLITTHYTAFNKNFCALATDVQMNGTQSYGSLDTVPRADHVHPVDTTRVPAGLAAAAGLTISATDRILGRASAAAGEVEEITCTAAARSVLDDATVSEMRTTLGFGRLLEQWVAPPANQSAAGIKGQLAYDSMYRYECVSTDTWVRTLVERAFQTI